MAALLVTPALSLTACSTSSLRSSVSLRSCPAASSSAFVGTRLQVTYFTGDETGGRLGTYKDKNFFKEEMADGRSADPMKLWPGPSSPVEFEYGYQALDGYISDNETGSSEVDSDISDGQGDIESLSNGRNQDRTNMLEELSWDPYLGDVTITEKDEDPPQYVPSPPIPAEDMKMQNNAEELLYNLKEILPGVLDLGKIDAVRSILSSSVEVQNPLLCWQGVDRFEAWLQVLAEAKAFIELHEIYYESLTEHRYKRWVYAIWTMTLSEDPQASGQQDGLRELGPKAEGGQESRGEQGGFDFSQSGEDLPGIKLSGETVFEMGASGLVSNVKSTWFVMQGDGEFPFTKAKLRLWHLMQRAFQ